jgi:hypothetical protein
MVRLGVMILARDNPRFADAWAGIAPAAVAPLSDPFVLTRGRA